MTQIKVTPLLHAGTDLDVVNAARVSMDKESDGMTDRDADLIHFLAKHKHKSPFNHAWAKFRVKAPIFVARQLVKHEYLPWNEVSRRYVDSEPEFYEPDSWRKRADNVKQGSSDSPIKEEPAAFDEYHRVNNEAVRTYSHLLCIGASPEQARMVLPQSMMTEWIWSGTLFAWFKMWNLRMNPHAQYESRIVAKQIGEQMGNWFPVSWAALSEHWTDT